MKLLNKIQSRRTNNKYLLIQTQGFALIIFVSYCVNSIVGNKDIYDGVVL